MQSHHSMSVVVRQFGRLPDSLFQVIAFGALDIYLDTPSLAISHVTIAAMQAVTLLPTYVVTGERYRAPLRVLPSGEQARTPYRSVERTVHDHT